MAQGAVGHSMRLSASQCLAKDMILARVSALMEKMAFDPFLGAEILLTPTNSKGKIHCTIKPVESILLPFAADK